MALKITQHDNTIILTGVLNTANIANFKTHFSFILTASKGVTLNIDKLKRIDVTAMQTLKTMYKDAVINQNMFFVEGRNSDSIYEAFQYPTVA